MGFLDVLLTKYNRLFDANGNAVPQRSNLQILGATFGDSASTDTSIVTLIGGGGTGGSGAILLAGFTQPAVGSTVSANISSTSTTGAGIAVAIQGGGLYTSNSVIDSTHVSLINQGGPINLNPGVTVSALATVTAVGQTAPFSTTVRANGQVNQLFSGTDTPAGLSPVYNALASLPAIVDDASTDNWPTFQNDIDGFPGSIPYYIDPTGINGQQVYRVGQPIFITNRTKCVNGLTIAGAQHIHDYGTNSGNTTLTSQAIPTDATKTWFGPIFALTTNTDPSFTHDAGTGIYYWVYQDKVSTAPGHGFNLQETGAGNCNGALAHNLSLFFNPQAGPTSGQISAIAHSAGTLVNGSSTTYPAAHAWGLNLTNAAGTLYLQAYLTTTTGLVQATAQTLAVGLPASTRSYVEMTYDSQEFTSGAPAPMLRVFIGGAVAIAHTVPAIGALSGVFTMSASATINYAGPTVVGIVNIGDWLQSSLQAGTYYQVAGVTFTGAATSVPVTLTFSASGHTITRTGGSFITDGFVIGQQVIGAGSASNNGAIGVLTGVSATVLTFASGVVNEGPISTASLTGGMGLIGLTASYTGTTGSGGTLTDMSGGPVVQKWYEDVTIGWQSEQWPMAGSIHAAIAGQELGSIRLGNTQIHKAAYTAPTTQQSVVFSGSVGHTYWLQNFDPANRSVTKTVTAKNPSGHLGYMCGLTNWNIEVGSLPVAGAPIWYPWHGTPPGGNLQNVTIERMCVASSGHVAYLQGAQYCKFQYMQLICNRGVTAAEYSYGTKVEWCQLGSGGASLAYTSHQWVFGMLSEMCEMDYCVGAGTGWVVVSSTFDMRISHTYMDNGVLGCIFAALGTKVYLETCWVYNEFTAMLVGLFVAINMRCIQFEDVSIGAIVSQSIPAIQLSGIIGVPQRGQSVMTTKLSGIVYNCWCAFASLGSYIADSLESDMISLDIDGSTNPGAATNTAGHAVTYVDPANVVPIYMRKFETGIWTFDMTGLSTYTMPPNLWHFGTWNFTNVSSDLVVTLPYNMRGRVKRWLNPSATNSITFNGPAAEALNVGSGAHGQIQCSETWTGSGSVFGSYSVA
jgi:hypothetical protein